MLLLSIRPKFVSLIHSGEKRVELRRQRPRISSGPALIYASAPTMALVSSFHVDSIVQLPLKLLWQSVRDMAGVTRTEFDDYFHGLDVGVAIRIGRLTEFERQIPLAELRQKWAAFQPPQSFRYIPQTDFDKLNSGRIKSRAA